MSVCKCKYSKLVILAYHGDTTLPSNEKIKILLHADKCLACRNALKEERAVETEHWFLPMHDVLIT